MSFTLTQIADKIIHIKQTWKVFNIQAKYNYKSKTAFLFKKKPK